MAVVETIAIQHHANPDRKVLINASAFDPDVHTRYEAGAADAAPSDVDVSDYHVGGGWYAVPGHAKNVRREEASRLLEDA